MLILFRYIIFFFKSTNQHGVHSPFIYGLVTNCFYDKKQYSAYKIIESYRKKLLSNPHSIKITDFGAGSRIFTSEKRSIRAIAKNAGMTPKRAKLLNRLIKYLQIENAIELGTSVGISTAAMAAGNKINITSLEGCENTAAVAKKQFLEFDFQNIKILTGEFEQLLNELTNPQSPIPNPQLTNPELQTINQKQQTKNNKQQTTNLIFFDGNHEKEATLRYFNKLLPLAKNDSVFIFDDIHWSKGMEEAWENIKNHPSVTVSIDTFYWGIVFFRREQEKEHFVIRL